MNVEHIDVFIIGAGPSGCVSAGYLHKNGVKVKVVEKAKFPRLVVGESLIPRVMDHLQEADLLDCLQKMNFQVKRGARFIRGNEICEFDFSKNFTNGWTWTWQVPRADFDNAMAQELLRKGVDLEFETEVLAVDFEGTDSLITVKNQSGTQKKYRAKFLIDSSGYGRVLPRLLGLSIPSKLEAHSSIFTHIKDIRRPENDIISFDVLDTKVWLWVIQFSNGNTSVGIVGTTEFINSLSDKSTTEALRRAIEMSDFYRDRFKDLDFLFEPIKLENYSTAVHKMYGDGFVLTGNSTEFLDPVFSSGVCFATETGILAAKLTLKQLQGQQVDWENDYTKYIQQGIDTFKTYVEEWYTGNLQKLFFYQPENPEVKRKICSVLAGYVWDINNPFVSKHKNIIKNIAYMLDMGEKPQI